ncbi:Golgi phosphoprotein 3 [Neocallimastix lanati (nom. inval.)]|jgi:Golgi phosphoprotein 3|uniref:Golgi phospho protein 3 n=1 Tax=Neocallimastix californiae TaxID=1754190 RepID=A0A1Y2AU64_9FUNG|nr:Golgi phosphoprotein 3 [Neocallimastix sp. JGI-2020a]ORY26091.1 Golgi phospho protein 3 [Neocallimastix californiae]|eukprot:ORY26091.1 Golgi phospho protein 3 [Neocallimastix californiae]
MASSEGLVKRRRGGGSSSYDSLSRKNSNDSLNKSDDEKDGYGKNKLTILEEVLLLGLKDSQGYLSFWNENISYVLRGCILIELSLRGRISVMKEVRKRPLQDRIVEVVNDTPTGEVLLDEALKYMKMEQQSVLTWIDLLCGETWNLMKIGYQLKQVRERIAKGLVDKGVLRTEKKNFVLFDMATHPIADFSVKERLIQRVINVLLGRVSKPDKRTIAMLCSAYAADVLDNALIGLNENQKETAYQKVDELLQENALWTDKAKSMGTTEIMAAVYSVYTRMESIL